MGVVALDSSAQQMTARVDFLVLHTDSTDLRQLLGTALADALSDALGETLEPAAVDPKIDVRYVWQRADGRRISAFHVDFDLDGEAVLGAIRAFCTSVAGSTAEGVQHLLKLTDPTLHDTNSRIAAEIFQIEMRLREVLSMIFLDVYGRRYYEFLEDVEVKLQGRDIRPSDMAAHWENQFFFISFGDYAKMNDRRTPSMDQLVSFITQAASYEEMRELVTAAPVKVKRYADFIASLRTLMDPLEKVRNCIAHNRTVPIDRLANYDLAKGQLLEAIRVFLESPPPLNGAPSAVEVGTGGEEQGVTEAPIPPPPEN